MKPTRLAPLLLACALSPALADEYQEAVGKAFPGFQILGRSDIRLNRSNMDPEIYERVKDHPGLIVGRFNADKLTDFAALIRGSELIHIPENKADMVSAVSYYEGYLVVCLGSGGAQYNCQKLATSPMRILKPHRDYLTKIAPGSASCTILAKFKAPKPKPNRNIGSLDGGPEEIEFKTDAIGLYGSDAIVYVHQPGGMYLECRTGG